MRSFLSPYGDKLQSIAKLASAIARYALSSPYGDSTDITANNILFCKFSPPYGDGTAGLQRYQVHAVFSPPYGDGTAVSLIKSNYM